MNARDMEIFTDAWALYDPVLDRNYMFHEEICRDVRGIVAARFRRDAFRVLDLGCGNARHVVNALEECPPSLYAGYDLSASALSQARTHLSRLGCPADLRQANLFDGLRPDGGTFDLIFSSFAVHHLSAPDKQRCLALARAHLAPKGIFLLVDISREPDEDRPAYLDHYCGWIRDTWTDLSAAERDSIFDHIRNYDFPETGEALHGMAVAAGFSRCVDVSAYRWHRTWLMESAGTL